jgi:4-oxalmesaconate hydratase
MIIDCHGHYTTAPKALENWRNAQIAGIQDPTAMPKAADLKISDDELRESIEANQLRLMNERGSDLTLFSPRASFMAHHIGDFKVSSTWAAICNELCYRVSTLFPDSFVPVAMLPQSPGVDPATCIPELEKCVNEYGAVGINLNPDPSGGHWTSPPLTDRHWYPIYEKMVEYDLPAMIHVSTSCNACFHTTGAHYLNADTTAFMQCIQGDLFKDFPTLKFLIPHGGGAVPYHWGRFRGLAQEMKKPLLEDHLLNNIFFDTCVYHQPGIDLLNTVIPVKNVLFASEMIGAVRGIDPQTGNYYDDTKRYIEASKILKRRRQAPDLRRQCAPGVLAARCTPEGAGAVTFSRLFFRSRLRGRRYPTGAHTAAVGALRQLRCGARSGVAPQNSLRAARCAQTAAASQLTRRAKRADPSSVLLATAEIDPAGYRLPRSRGLARCRWHANHAAAKPCPASSAARPNPEQRKAVAEGDRSSEAPKAERLRAWFCREDCQTRRNPTCTN